MSSNTINNNHNEEEVIDLLDASSSEDDDEPQNATATQRQPRTCLQRPCFARKRGRASSSSTTAAQSSGSSDVDDYNYEDEAEDIYNINDSTLSQHDIPAVASAASAVVSNNTSFSDGYANNNNNNNSNNLFESFLQRQRQRQRQRPSRQSREFISAFPSREEGEGEVIDLQSPSPPRSAVAASVSASAAVARGNNNATNNNNSATSSYYAAASSSWSCAQCTLTNPPYRSTCNACSAHRYAPSSLSTAGRAVVAVPGRGATVSAAARRDFNRRNGRRTFDSSSDDDSEDERAIRRHNIRARTRQLLAQTAQTSAAASAARASLLTAHAALVAELSSGTTASDSYEQLLQLFGDGTENISSRGASSSTISSLPTNIITNPNEELPEDKRTCYICLEEFVNGDVRKCLPCLHGYHEKCVDRWLVENGVCPVCKTPVSD